MDGCTVFPAPASTDVDRPLLIGRKKAPDSGAFLRPAAEHSVKKFSGDGCVDREMAKRVGMAPAFALAVRPKMF